MPLLMLIICAGALAAYFVRRFPSPQDTPVLAVFIAAATVPLGIGAYCVASFSIYYALLFFYISGVFSLFYLGRMRKVPKLPNDEKTDYAFISLVGLLFFTLLLAYFYLPLPIIENNENSGWLGLIKNYGYHAKIYFDATSSDSGAPHLAYALYAISNTPHLPVFPSLIFATLTLYVLYALAQNFTSKGYSLIAVAAFACSPMFLFFITAPGFYPLFTFYILASLLAMLLAAKHRNPFFIVCAGVLCGGACGVYYSGYLFLVALTLLLALSTRDAKATLTFAGAALLFAAPWLVRNYYFIGNPVHPYFQAVFSSSLAPGPYIAYIGLNSELQAKTVLETAQHLIRMPWRMVMQPQDFATWRTNPGVFLIAFIVPAFAFGNTRVRLLAVFAASLGGLAYFFGADFLQLCPYIALLCVATAASLPHFPQITQKAFATAALAFILTGSLMQLGVVLQHRDTLLGRAPKSEYLNRHIKHYPIFEKLNDTYNDGGTVLLLEPRSWYLDMPAIYNPWALKIVAAQSEEEQRAWLVGRNIKYLVVHDAFHGEEEVEKLLAAWTRNRTFFSLSESLEYPAKDGARVDRIKIYTFNRKPGAD